MSSSQGMFCAMISLLGLGGDDILIGYNGDDTLDGGDGDDSYMMAVGTTF